MKENTFFSFRRLNILLRLEIARIKKYLLYTLGATVGIMLIISIMMISFSPNIDFYSFYYIGFYISGILIAGTAFSDFRKKESTIMYLTLPASAFEKLLSQLIIVSLGFILFYTAAFFIFWGISFIWRSLFELETQLPFYIFNKSEFLHSILQLWFWQAIFLIGSASFSKAPLVKTTASIFIVIFFLGIYIMFFITKILFDDLQFGTHYTYHGKVNVINSDLLLILIPFLWAVTFFKIKEKQV